MSKTRDRNLEFLKQVAQELPAEEIERLESFAKFLKRQDKTRVLELDLWAVNEELIKAGIDPYKYPDMAAAVRAAIGKRSDEEIEKISKIGAGIVLDIVKGWRREPIPFDQKVIKYEIEKLLARALKEMK